MAIDPDLCLDVPEDFDDSGEESQVHPMARKLFPVTTAEEAFRQAHEWVKEHDVRLIDVSWKHVDGEPYSYQLSIYFTFELEPEDAE
ncbi:hypothetical protein [Streptomyces niger]|uniref:hypothetical protein n=1 Tax=Streptomyces niger TaxID=66373 RepID=UPI00069B81A2|nr:hypothetical protein [Streptomyces niger]